MSAKKINGMVQVFLGDRPDCSGPNMVVSQASEILCRLMSPDRMVSISHVYFEFSASSVSPTTLETDITFFDNMPVGVDYLEIPLLQNPRIVTGDDGVSAVFYASTGWAEQTPVLGANGEPFVTGSVVRAVSMVASSKISGDRWLFARFVSDVTPKPDGIDIGIQWKIELPHPT